MQILPRRRGPWLQLGTARGYEWNVARLPIAGLPPALNGFRILHVTDFHARTRWDAAYDDLLEEIRQAGVDIILGTGDFADNRFDHRKALPAIERLFKGFTSRLGTYTVLGNHDGDLLAPVVADWNVTIIDHRRLQLHSGNATLDLIGLAGVDRGDVDGHWLQAIGEKPANTVRIVLSHFPDSIMQCGTLKPDIYLCGHTHGGQICLPGRRPIISHDSLPVARCSGIHREQETWMVANRGFGFSSHWQIRLFCPAEVIEIVLVSAEETE